MSREKMELARELIRQHHYDEARSILQTIDDPKAREWLAKLDKKGLYPPTKKPFSKVLIIGVILSSLSVLVVVTILILVLSHEAAVKKTHELLTLYCMEADKKADFEGSRQDCSDFATTVFS